MTGNRSVRSVSGRAWRRASRTICLAGRGVGLGASNRMRRRSISTPLSCRWRRLATASSRGRHGRGRGCSSGVAVGTDDVEPPRCGRSPDRSIRTGRQPIQEQYARLDLNQRPLPSRGSALSSELRASEPRRRTGPNRTRPVPGTGHGPNDRRPEEVVRNGKPVPGTGRVLWGHGAGGIRTHGLELMRLARTASPLPRSGLAE
jgi:hypothetical protein